MTTPAQYKLCPECRVEYTLAAVRCADCGVDLVHPHELAELDRELVDFPPVSELQCVRVAPMAWIQALSAALQEAGVTHRVERSRTADAPEGQRTGVFGDVPLFGLYVRSEDVPSTREIDASIAAQILPDEAPVLAAGEEDACPACGAAVGSDATDCPECGLAFG